MLLGGDLVQEQAGGFDDDVCADLVPLQVRGIAFLREADLLAVDHQRVAFDADVTLEAAVHAVVLQHVGQVVGLQQVVDRHDLDVAEVLDGAAQHVAADAAEAVDADLDGHVSSLLEGFKKG
ncbi:hypothetical protein D9M69_585140 [compost metagenome]